MLPLSIKEFVKKTNVLVEATSVL